jgi:hypothetical protein
MLSVCFSPSVLGLSAFGFDADADPRSLCLVDSESMAFLHDEGSSIIRSSRVVTPIGWRLEG